MINLVRKSSLITEFPNVRKEWKKRKTTSRRNRHSRFLLQVGNCYKTSSIQTKIESKTVSTIVFGEKRLDLKIEQTKTKGKRENRRVIE